MVLFKKLIFAPFFLIAFALLVYNLNSLLKSYDLIFSLSTDILINLITISIYFLLSSFLFVLFATMADELKIILPVGVISASIPFIFIPSSLAVIFAVAFLASIVFVSLSLEGNLKSYLNFQPTSLLGPSIRHLTTFLVISFCLIYFFSTTQLISKNGFEIPDSLIDTALKMTPQLPQMQTKQASLTPSLSKEQIDLLKQNPDLLNQYGLDPSILDSLNQPQSSNPPQNLTNSLIKETVKDQIQNLIKPYQGFVPAGLAILLFVTLHSLLSLINLLIYPLIWFIFFILEQTGFIKFTTETREIKKLVV